MTTHAHRSVLSAGIVPGRTAPTRTLFDLLLAWQDRAESRSRLAALEDCHLNDLGIDRAVARREAAKPFWRA